MDQEKKDLLERVTALGHDPEKFKRMSMEKLQAKYLELKDEAENDGPKDMDDERIFKGVNAIGKAINRSRMTVLKLIRTHKLPAYRLGAVWECKVKHLKKWVEYEKKEVALGERIYE